MEAFCLDLRPLEHPPQVVGMSVLVVFRTPLLVSRYRGSWVVVDFLHATADVCFLPSLRCCFISAWPHKLLTIGLSQFRDLQLWVYGRPAGCASGVNQFSPMGLGESVGLSSNFQSITGGWCLKPRCSGSHSVSCSLAQTQLHSMCFTLMQACKRPPADRSTRGVIRTSEGVDRRGWLDLFDMFVPIFRAFVQSACRC